MEKKNNNGVLIGTIIGLSIAIIVVGCLFYTGTISFGSNKATSSEQSSGNPTNDNTTEKNNVNNDSIDFDSFLSNVTKSLGWLVVLHNSSEFGERKNIDYLSTIEDKQVFVMEYILNNQENHKNFIVLNAVSGEKLTNASPTDQMTIAYYPYSLFNQEYKKFFGEDFDATKRIKAPGSNNEYDKSEQYIYYSNRRPGRNGQYVSKMTVEDTKLDDTTKIYTALVNMTYSDTLSQEIGVNSEKAEITYTIENSNIILKTFIIK